MNDYRISCINKSNRGDVHEQIKFVGINGSKFTVQQIVNLIKQGNTFYVVQNGIRVKVIWAKSVHGHDYIKTIADGYEPNNLLSLPEC